MYILHPPSSSDERNDGLRMYRERGTSSVSAYQRLVAKREEDGIKWREIERAKNFEGA